MVPLVAQRLQHARWSDALKPPTSVSLQFMQTSAVGAQAITSPDFAIDPTDPHFARLRQPEQVMEVVRKRQSKKRQAVPEAAAGDTEDRGAKMLGAGAAVAALADSLKRKAKAKPMGKPIGKRVKVG